MDDPLYMSDNQIRDRIGIGADAWHSMIAVLEARGFPKKDPLFANKRFWPAVKTYLFKHNGIDGTMVTDAHAQENWNEPETRRRPASARS